MFSFSCIKNISNCRALLWIFVFLVMALLYVVMNLDNIRKDKSVEPSRFESSNYAHSNAHNVKSTATSRSELYEMFDVTATVDMSTDHNKLPDYNSSIHYNTSAKYNMSANHNMSTTTAHAQTNCSIVVCPIGNLGNQIWEYMSLFVVWQKYKRSGFKPYLEDRMFDSLKVLFPKLSIPPSDGYLCDEPKSKVISRHEPLSVYDSWFNADNSKKCDNIYLEEYSSRYDEILLYGVDEIRKEMVLAPQLVADCQGILLFHKQRFHMEGEDVIFVGMHYRGTDYGHHLEVNYGITETPTSKYYLKAMEYFKTTFKHNHIIFVLVTVDLKWLKKNEDDIVNSTNIVIVNPTNGDRLQDLVLLSQCNHTIINYGTFGVTAGLLAGGITFVYDLKLPLDHRGSTIGTINPRDAKASACATRRIKYYLTTLPKKSTK